MSFALRNITLPPNSRMPVSNETRVRVEALEKISAQVCPASGLRSSRARSRLNTMESRRIFSMSAFGNFSNDNRCFILRFGNFRPKESLYPKQFVPSLLFLQRIRGAPEKPRSRRAMRTPDFAEREQFLRRRHFTFFVGVAKSGANAKIVCG